MDRIDNTTTRVAALAPDAGVIGPSAERSLALPPIVSPDEVFTVEEAAERLRRSVRHVQRLLSAGRLEGKRPGGPAVITAVSLWRYLGVEREMTDAWIEYCRRLDRGNGA